ncbi:MAG TPA: hypothetical protein VMN58_01740 [Acidimicrobiales bacterium]|nr:hypothetical protein [Acidimicrobiales bacterium]
MRRFLLASLLTALLAPACGGDDAGGEAVPTGPAREAAVYAAIVLHVAETIELEEGRNPESRTVYVEPSDPDRSIPLEVQAGVVQWVEGQVTVDFIDQRRAAVLVDDPGQPVREGTALLALGTVPDGHLRVDVDVRRYFKEGEEERVRYALRRVGREWRVNQS